MGMNEDILNELRKLNTNIERISNIFFQNEFPNQKNVIDAKIEKNIFEHFTKRKIKSNATNNQNLLRKKYHKQKS